jgi:hypothetical protein
MAENPMTCLIVLAFVASTIAQMRDIPSTQPDFRKEIALHDAAARLVAARFALKEANAELVMLRARVAVSLKDDRERKAAESAMRAANRDAEAAKKGSMRESPQYPDLVMQFYEADKFIRSISRLPDGTPASVQPTEEDIRAAVIARSEAQLALRRIEKEVEATNKKFQAAEEKLKAAKRVWNGFEQRLNTVLKADPRYDSIIHKIDAADKVYRDAEASYKSARDSLRPIEISGERARQR